LPLASCSCSWLQDEQEAQYLEAARGEEQRRRKTSTMRESKMHYTERTRLTEHERAMPLKSNRSQRRQVNVTESRECSRGIGRSLEEDRIPRYAWFLGYICQCMEKVMDGSTRLICEQPHGGVAPDGLGRYLFRGHKEGDSQSIGNRVARQLLHAHGIGPIEYCHLLQLPLNPQNLPITFTQSDLELPQLWDMKPWTIGIPHRIQVTTIMDAYGFAEPEIKL